MVDKTILLMRKIKFEMSVTNQKLNLIFSVAIQDIRRNCVVTIIYTNEHPLCVCYALPVISFLYLSLLMFFIFQMDHRGVHSCSDIRVLHRVHVLWWYGLA